MSKYTYVALSDPDEIRVLVLEPPLSPAAPLHGSFKRIRLSTHGSRALNSAANQPITVKGKSAVNPGESVSRQAKSKWKWRYKEEVHTSLQIKRNRDGQARQLKMMQSTFSLQCVRRDYKAGSYDALSYTWGDLNKPNEINIKSRTLKIGNNLREALLMLRLPDSARTLWVDAICINQDDIKERNHQVHIMQRIYSEAASVVVWLGSLSQSSSAAMELIIEYNRPQTGRKKELLQHTTESLAGLSEIFLRSWFKRIWIIQEVVAARELVIFCGHFIIPWDFASKFCDEIKEKEFAPEEKSKFLKSSGYQNFTTLDEFRAFKGMTSLTKYLQCTKDYEASDLRDKLYALIGVACDILPGDIVPDYTKPTRIVFFDLVYFLATKRRSLDIISSGRLLRPALTTPSGSQPEPEEEIPSWLPDWRVSKGLRPLNSEGIDGAYYRAGANTEAVVSLDAFPLALEVEGIVVDKVGFVDEAINSLTQETSSKIERWEHIVGQHLLSDSNFEGVALPDFWTTVVVDMAAGAAKSFVADRATGKHKEFQRMRNGSVLSISGKGSQQAWVAHYSYADAVARAVNGRRFFLTVEERMGLGVPEIQRDDMVVVLKGCSVPLIMRAVGDHMVIVGESYVSGIMEGEVMADLVLGKYKTRVIRLH